MKNNEYRLKRLVEELNIYRRTRREIEFPLGTKYGRLTVSGYYPHSKASWGVVFICDCGKTKETAYPNQVRSGLVKSCGCLNQELSCKRGKKWPWPYVNQLPRGEAAFNNLYRGYAFGAKVRGLVFELSKDFFKNLTQQSCVYCGAKPSCGKRGRLSTSRYRGVYIYNGIDRFDNSIGYTEKNSVPCCKQCNRAKRDSGIVDFIAWAKRVARFQKNKRCRKLFTKMPYFV